MNNTEQRFFLVVQWSSRRVLRYGALVLRHGPSQTKGSSIHKHAQKQLQLINNTIPTIHDKIVQNSKDDKLWDLQPVGFWTQAAWWIEFKHITIRLTTQKIHWSILETNSKKHLKNGSLEDEKFLFGFVCWRIFSGAFARCYLAVIFGGRYGQGQGAVWPGITKSFLRYVKAKFTKSSRVFFPKEVGSLLPRYAEDRFFFLEMIRGGYQDPTQPNQPILPYSYWRRHRLNSNQSHAIYTNII